MPSATNANAAAWGGCTSTTSTDSVGVAEFAATAATMLTSSISSSASVGPIDASATFHNPPISAIVYARRHVSREITANNGL
jgi:hypothetical protein